MGHCAGCGHTSSPPQETVPGRGRGYRAVNGENPVRGHSDETEDSGQPGVIAPPDVCPQLLDASRTRTTSRRSGRADATTRLRSCTAVDHRTSQTQADFWNPTRVCPAARGQRGRRAGQRVGSTSSSDAPHAAGDPATGRAAGSAGAPGRARPSADRGGHGRARPGAASTTSSPRPGRHAAAQPRTRERRVRSTRPESRTRCPGAHHAVVALVARHDGGRRVAQRVLPRSARSPSPRARTRLAPCTAVRHVGVDVRRRDLPRL